MVFVQNLVTLYLKASVLSRDLVSHLRLRLLLLLWPLLLFLFDISHVIQKGLEIISGGLFRMPGLNVDGVVDLISGL